MMLWASEHGRVFEVYHPDFFESRQKCEERFRSVGYHLRGIEFQNPNMISEMGRGVECFAETGNEVVLRREFEL